MSKIVMVSTVTEPSLETTAIASSPSILPDHHSSDSLINQHIPKEVKLYLALASEGLKQNPAL